MSDLLDNPAAGIQEMDDEAPVQYFCKFTFAQFFTIMILAVFTLGFMFYLGARYGNDYLRLGVGTPESSAITTAAISTVPGATGTDPEKAEEMLKSAREVLQQQQSEKLQGQVAAVLQNPAMYQQQMAQQAGNLPAGAVPPGAVAPGTVPVGAVTPQMAEQMAAQNQPVAAMPQSFPPSSAPATTVSETAPQRVNEYEAPPETQSERPSMPQPRAIPQQPTADDEPAAAPTKSAAGTMFSVQVGASQNVGEANQWVQKWRDRGYSAFVMVADLPDKGRWYRVRLGSFPSRQTAEAFAGQLKTKEQVDAIAVQNE